MIRIFFTAILLLSFAVSVSAQTKHVKSNLEIFEETISVELEKLYYLPGVDRNQKFLFYIEEFDGLKNVTAVQKYKFLVSLLKKTSEKNRLSYSITEEAAKFSEDSSFNRFRFRNIDFATAYPRFIKKKFLGEKTIERKISTKMNVDIAAGNSDQPIARAINESRSDEIGYDDYSNYETDEFSFTKASPPELGSFEAVLFPALLVTVSAAATVLFFIIRTK